jgi:hypothetical protein
MSQEISNAHLWALAAQVATRYDVSIPVARAWVESCPDEQRIVTICDQVLNEEHELTSRAFYHRLRLIHQETHSTQSV